MHELWRPQLGLYLPALHVSHERLMPLDFLPGGQVVQARAPGPAMRPFAQYLQVDWLYEFW